MAPKIHKGRGPTGIVASYPIGILPASEPPPESDLEAGGGVDLTRPAAKAPKDQWVAYASGLGLNVEGLAKPKIIAKVDSIKG